LVPASDIGRHVGGVLAGDEVLGHRLDGVLDLVGDDLPDRADGEALLARPRERVVEVRAHGALRSRVGEPVARRAPLLEQLLAVRGAAARLDPAGARVAPGGDPDGQQGGDRGEELPHARTYAGGWLDD
jgi:hypothetical protein